MEFFRMRLILALVAGITLISVASTYFEVLTHKHALRLELERRTALMQRGCDRRMRRWDWPCMTCRAGWRRRRDLEGFSERFRAAHWIRPFNRVLTRSRLATWTISSGWKKRFPFVWMGT
jgi:hypothetical protein